MMLLEMTAENALLEGKLQGMILPIYENERPMQGLAGRLDWRLFGSLSRGLKAGVIQGKPGECSYVPVSRHGRVYHMILVGGGPLGQFQKRGNIPDSSFTALKRNLIGLGVSNIGLSRSDFAAIGDDVLSKKLDEVSFWVVP